MDYGILNEQDDAYIPDLSVLLKQDLRQFPLKPKQKLITELKTGFVDFPGTLLLQLVKAESLSEKSSSQTTIEDVDNPNDDSDETLTAKGRMKYLCALGKCRFTLLEVYCFSKPQSRDLVPGSKVLLRGWGAKPQLDVIGGFILIHTPSQLEWIGGDVELQALAYEESRRVKQSRQKDENRTEASIKFIPFGHPQPPLLSRLDPPQYWTAESILQGQFSGATRKATDMDTARPDESERREKTKPKDVTTNKLIAGRAPHIEGRQDGQRRGRGGSERGGSDRGRGGGRGGGGRGRGGRRRGGRGAAQEGITVQVQGGRTLYGAAPL